MFAPPGAIVVAMGFWDRLRGRSPSAQQESSESTALVLRRPVVDATLPAEVNNIRLSLYDGLQNLMAGLGNERDKRFFTNYTLDFAANRSALEAMYMSSWLASKIVSIPAEDMTREGAEISWEGRDAAGKEDIAITAEIERLDMWGVVTEALRWARLYGGAGIVVGIKGQALDTPLNEETIVKGSLECLLVYDRWYLSTSGSRDLKIGSPNFGFPNSYIIADTALNVHWTRVIRFSGRPLPKTLWLANAYWDGSELAHIIDNIKDYDAGRAGTASMLWDASVDVLRLALLKETLSEDNGEALVRKRLMTALLSKSMNRALVLDKEDEYSQKQTQFSGVKDILGQFILDVSGAADIPVTRLFGQSPAGLTATGESDIRNYYDHIASKRKTQLRRPLMRLAKMLIRSAIGRLPENLTITFPPLWQVSATEQATIEKTNAERDKIYLDQGVVTEGLVARQLKADDVYSQMEEEDVKMAKELALQPDPNIAPASEAPTDESNRNEQRSS